MKEEYRKAMEKISLSDDDRARILANVRQSSQKLEENGMNQAASMPRYSWRRVGAAVAAAAAVLITSATWISIEFFGQESDFGGDPASSLASVTAVPEEDWMELESVDEIGKKTDCRTYMLGDVSKKYKVKKVKVSNAARHVKIVYQHQNKGDKIVFEYKEEENAPEIKDQFSGENELSVEKVEDLDVCMYGDEKCNGLTWEKESCTFGVKMTKACSKARAKRLVSGTKEGIPHKTDQDLTEGIPGEGKDEREDKKDKTGWDGNEEGAAEEERQRELKKIYNELGFRVTIASPAEDIRYRLEGDYEFFAFSLDENEELAECQITGYAGWEDYPEGILDDYSEDRRFSEAGTDVILYKSGTNDCIFTFKKQELQFLLKLEDWQGEQEEAVFSDLFRVLRVSLEESEKEEEDLQAERVAFLRDTAQRIQNAVSERSLKKMADYLQFPLVIKDLKMTVNSRSGWLELSQNDIFTTEWVDAVVNYDTRLIKADTAEFNMGDAENYLLCKIKDDMVFITEIHRKKTSSVSEPEEEPDEDFPEEEEIPEDSPEPTATFLPE